MNGFQLVNVKWTSRLIMRDRYESLYLLLLIFQKKKVNKRNNKLNFRVLSHILFFIHM